ncbi:MAG: hypothetical protein FWB98_06045 [Defluviitaleaceae bacterium]|nr:hypothetical protein [Defluviitaleaceae bacterium]
MNNKINIDTAKIRLMSKMALYDKKGFQKDAEANEYFRHDFIYKKNMSMRFYVGIGILILVAFYALRVMSVAEGDIFSLDFQAEIMRIVVFVVIVVLFYSFVGTIIFTREFLASQKRVKAYFGLMRELHGEPPEEEVSSKAKAKAKSKALPEPEPEEEEEPVVFRPYRSRRVDTSLTYNYRSTDDPSLWEDEENK